MLNPSDRGGFLLLAGLFEGGLALLAIALGTFADIWPLDHAAWKWSAVGWGAAAAIPLFALFELSQRYPVGGLLRIQRLLINTLGPPLSACRWYELLLLSLYVGFCEELLFRGWLQPWLESWGWLAALLVSNLIFGAAHAVTPLYFVLAGLMGCYLGFLLDATGERNLLTPMMTHALYDYLAFLVIARAYRTQRRSEQQTERHEGEPHPD